MILAFLAFTLVYASCDPINLAAERMTICTRIENITLMDLSGLLSSLEKFTIDLAEKQANETTLNDSTPRRRTGVTGPAWPRRTGVRLSARADDFCGATRSIASDWWTGKVSFFRVGTDFFSSGPGSFHARLLTFAF